MNNEITIKHQMTSFSERKNYFLKIFLVIIICFAVIHFISNGLENIIGTIVFFGIIIGFSILINIRRTKKYLVDFIYSSEKLVIRYFEGSKELNLESTIDETSIVLKNTTTRFGFNCELVLKIENNKFIINDTFDWTLNEMKELFEFIMNQKKIELTYKDKFNLARLEEKLEKRKSLKLVEL